VKTRRLVRGRCEPCQVSYAWPRPEGPLLRHALCLRCGVPLRRTTSRTPAQVVSSELGLYQLRHGVTLCTLCGRATMHCEQRPCLTLQYHLDDRGESELWAWSRQAGLGGVARWDGSRL
jgi:hypothetical protein